MGFFDGLVDRAKDIGSSALSDYAAYTAQKVVEPLVKMAPAPRGNQTAAQVEGGSPGAAQPVAVSATVSRGFALSGMTVAAIAVGAYFLLGRRK